MISMSGDGGLGMLMGELLTAKLHDLPVKTIVFSNSSLGMVKLEMLVDGLPDYETDDEPVDCAAIARGSGTEAIRIERPEDVTAGLKQALAHGGTFLADLVTDPNTLSILLHISAGKVKGVAFAAGRTVLDGGAGKMLDLERANLRNIPHPCGPPTVYL